MNLLHPIDRIGEYARFAIDARRFLKDKITPAQAGDEIERRLANRAQAFLRVLEEEVYARPDTAYAKLLLNAGIDFEGALRLVEQNGVEGALERLYDAGVYITGEELKGRQPIVRGGVEIYAAQTASTRRNGLGWQSSGSTGSPMSVGVDFRSVYDSSMRLAVCLDAHGLVGRPAACLGTSRPSSLWFAKLGTPAEKHFAARNSAGWSDVSARDTSLTKIAVSAVQLVQRRRFVNPEFSTRAQTVRAAEWLAQKRAGGAPGLLWTFGSPAVRVCQAAAQRGLDISGSVMLAGGEPITPGKASTFAAVGAKAIVVYVSVETGVIAHSCATPSDVDDVHFYTDKVAVIQRPKQVAPGVSVGALAFTSLSVIGRQLLLNFEMGDYAALEQRDCGCSLGKLGLTTHLSGIRSHEKLTSEGVTFIGGRLLDLLERTLPARFGGNTTDYQLVEEEVDGLAKVSILVAPSVGPVDEEALIESVVAALRAPDEMAPVWTQMWQQGNTLRVVRREPYQTGNAKVLPLHILRRS